MVWNSAFYHKGDKVYQGYCLCTGPINTLENMGKYNGGVAVWYHQYLLVMLEE